MIFLFHDSNESRVYFKRLRLYNDNGNNDPEKSHDQSRCEKCRELGYLCIKKYTKPTYYVPQDYDSSDYDDYDDGYDHNYNYDYYHGYD